MTYLLSAANAAATWKGRADQAWGSSRQWNLNSSFESDLAAMTTDRNTWQSRANQAWGQNRSWSSGPSFESQAWSGGAYNNGQLWSTMYNNLLAGLNSPDGLQTAAYAISHNAGGTEIQIGTFTFGRSGHFYVAVVASLSGTPNQNNATSTLRLAGALVTSQTANVGAASGARNWWHGYQAEADVSAGQTVSVFYNAFATGNPTSGTCNFQAHFVPTSANHN